MTKENVFHDLPQTPKVEYVAKTRFDSFLVILHASVLFSIPYSILLF